MIACGGGDGGGNGPDTEPPSVTISAPASGAAVSGDVTIAATASDNQSVAGVQFTLDGAALGAEVGAAPFQVVWHSSTAPSGVHTLGALARDPSGNTGNAASVEVSVTELATGQVRIITATTGEGSDSDGYTAAVDGVFKGTVGANDTLLIDALALGAHQVALAGVSPFCVAADGPSRQVTVGAEPGTARFDITCEAAPPGRIAFTAAATTGAPLEIRTIRPDGTDETTVATDGDYATWSPDGTQIAFLRDAIGKTTLFRVNADGTGLTKVAVLPWLAQELDWSSGGTLVFSAVRPKAGSPDVIDLYFIDADGSNLRPVFPSAALRLSPAWSPDGTRLVYSAGRPDDQAELTVVNADGSSPVSLTSGFRDLSASWSPDGTMLAFRRDDANAGSADLWVIGTDGLGLRRLTQRTEMDLAPSWSPDGSWVAFSSEDPSGQPLLMVRADGSELIEVPGAFQFAGQPDWDSGPE